MSSPAFWPHLNRWLVSLHRWSGVALFLVVIAWFASGVVLLYVPFPALPESDRLAHSEAVDGQRLMHTPAEALAKAPGTEQLVLTSVAGHPTYLAWPASGSPVVISADDAPVTVSALTAQTVAEHFAQTRSISVEGPLAYDQWIVHQRFDPFRPFYRVRLGDADQTDLYVSARTGQVLQRTRGAERGWNWAGAVLHWIYFTPLRKSWSAWNQTVWWLSLITLLTSMVGTWLGIHRFLKTRAAGRTTWSPFRGWMKWHHVTGLFASVIVVIWIFSGWLSMDHGRLFSMGHVAPEQAGRFRGLSLQAVVEAVPTNFVQRTGSASEFRFSAVAGRPLIAALGGQSEAGRVWWLDEPGAPPTREIDGSLLMAGLRAAWPNAGLIESVVSRPDFYAVAESLGSTAVGFNIGTPNPSRVYVDSVSGSLLVVMDRSRRTYAWVYYALHTFNFPALIDRPGLRQTSVLLLMLVGIAFSATGAVLGFKRLRRTLAR